MTLSRRSNTLHFSQVETGHRGKPDVNGAEKYSPRRAGGAVSHAPPAEPESHFCGEQFSPHVM